MAHRSKSPYITIMQLGALGEMMHSKHLIYRLADIVANSDDPAYLEQVHKHMHAIRKSLNRMCMNGSKTKSPRKLDS